MIFFRNTWFWFDCFLLLIWLLTTVDYLLNSSTSILCRLLSCSNRLIDSHPLPSTKCLLIGQDFSCSAILWCATNVLTNQRLGVARPRVTHAQQKSGQQSYGAKVYNKGLSVIRHKFYCSLLPRLRRCVITNHKLKLLHYTNSEFV